MTVLAVEAAPVLRRCPVCGLEAHTEQDLAKFTADRRARHGHGNTCKKCRNTRQNQPKIHDLQILDNTNGYAKISYIKYCPQGGQHNQQPLRIMRHVKITTWLPETLLPKEMKR